ncbi:hypothetical protein ACG02S_04445 [Roseateles sp. DC23W]|uniref:Uncharacterized protein n=1 Tax=Pelomonas dachongensis TaxID=3299029 RepID=A0ABW7EI79_9BURK
MKRTIFGIVWFVVFWFGSVIIGGAIAGGIAGAQVKPSSLSEGFDLGKEAGHTAGAEFAQKYSSHLLIGALILAIGGTALGVLPGTKKKPKG